MAQSFVQINVYFHKSYVSFLEGYIESILAYKYLNSVSVFFLIYLSKEKLQNGKFASMFLF